MILSDVGSVWKSIYLALLEGGENIQPNPRLALHVMSVRQGTNIATSIVLHCDGKTASTRTSVCTIIIIHLT